jgi:hypothetical protein
LWELNYAIKGLAYATGGFVSGKLIGDFGFQYEPGEYVFFKDGSGIGTGVNSIITGFDPVLFRLEQSQVTGFITGTRMTGVNIDGCVFQIGEGLPLIAIPEFIYDASGNATEPISIGLILPTDTGEFLRENIDYFLKRLNISDSKLLFFGGTMFWIRYSILKDTFKDNRITLHDFGIGHAPDGTRAHAMERVFANIVRDKKYELYAI